MPVDYKRIWRVFGSKAELARRLGVQRACVHNWEFRGQIPVSRVDSIVKLSRGKLCHADLRPDAYARRARA